jgi:hypothetical protein
MASGACRRDHGTVRVTFQPYTFTRSPARVEADTKPGVAASRIEAAPGRRLYSLVAVAGFVTYGFGLPAAIWAWCS